MPEQDERTGALYDFLYRDAGRITSWYSQLFSGRLTSLERLNQETETSSRDLKLSAAVLAGDILHSKQIQESSKRTFDPHETITTDVLATLSQGGHISSDIDGAANGSLIIATGTLMLIDSTMFSIMRSTFESQLKALRSAPKRPGMRESLAQLEDSVAIITAIAFPSAFILNIKGGGQVVGTLQDGGMHESITSYYFKHGWAGISEVSMIGIKEVADNETEIVLPEFFSAVRTAAAAMSTLLFPEDSIKATPLVLFRDVTAHTLARY